MNKFRLTAICGGLLLSAAANISSADAQGRYNLYSPGSYRPSVIVDLTVLDKLGPEPTLPSLLRPNTPVTPAAPTQAYNYSLGPSQATAAPSQVRLLAPPTEPPRSQVTLPDDLKQFSQTRAYTTPRRSAAIAPTPPSLAKPPSRAKSKTPRTVAATPAQNIMTPPKLVRRATPTPRVAAAIPAAHQISSPLKAVKPVSPPRIATPKAPPVLRKTATKVAAATPKKRQILAPVRQTKPVSTFTPPPSAPKITPPVRKAAIARKSIAPPVAAPKAIPKAKAVAPKAARIPVAAPRKTISTRASVPPPPSLTKPTRPQIALVGPATQTVSNGTLQIRFAPSSRDLPAKAETALADLAKKLTNNPGLRVQIHGYASGPSESPSQARHLSLFRALSVRTYLVKKGIRSTRIDVRALGSTIDDGPKDRVDVLFPRS